MSMLIAHIIVQSHRILCHINYVGPCLLSSIISDQMYLLLNTCGPEARVLEGKIRTIPGNIVKYRIIDSSCRWTSRT